MVRPLGALGIVALVALSTPARAQPMQNAAIAEALFRDGQSLLKAGKVAEACEKLSASLQLDPALGTLLNLAACHEKQGKVASAWAEFSDVAARAAQQGQKDREAYARGRVKALEPRLVRGSIVVAEAVPGLEVKLDGNPVPSAAWGISLPLDPGEHRVEAKAAGYVTWNAVVDVPVRGEGPKIKVSKLVAEQVASEAPAQLQAPAPAVVPVPAPEVAGAPALKTVAPVSTQPEVVLEAGPSRTPALVSGGSLIALGVGGVGAAAFFGLKAKGLASDRDALCAPGQPCYDQAAFDADHDARGAQQWAILSGVAGALAVGGGALLLVRALGDEAAEAPAAAPAQEKQPASKGADEWSSLWIAPTAAVRSVGLVLGGQF